ncbi:hypothetical protein EXIGLDRAFT_782082 [Exidia glandulosa HHB12029]|uniref:Uncharacterized protein n=1 Tax=Exidia glandulosa HHB12029 TaxID=1314781 RepID=A0A165B0L5_EXIGL|nr:hypothetical protein EXIGLDRAFT_782082 [Exidia glandulosa HHB12029]
MTTGGAPPGIAGDVYRINRLRRWQVVEYGRVPILTRSESRRFAHQCTALAHRGYFFDEIRDEFVYRGITPAAAPS